MGAKLGMGRPCAEGAPASALASRWLTLLGFSVALGLLALGSLAALSARHDAWVAAQQQSDNILLSLQRDIARNLAAFDLSLQGAKEAQAEPGLNEASAGVRRRALFDRAAAAEDLGAILLLDAGGDILESSIPMPRGINFAGREEFAVHRDRPDMGLFVGRATSSWFDDEASIWLSRRLASPDGQFAGVVAGALRLSYFQHLFERIDVGPHGCISLLRTDGRLVWRTPASDATRDLDLSGTNFFGAMARLGQGRFRGVSDIDQTERLYTFGRVGDLPLIVSVNASVEDIYARWRGKALIIVPILVVMCASVVILSLLFRREMLRREEAERGLAEAALELTRLATTDALTGLPNRRSFETAFARDWRRAIRMRSALSLLMVDVDHFKSFNDHYGHQEGDRALRAVAEAIGLSIPSRFALAARLGGEEFMVVLPDCEALAARLIAERVRAAVERLALPHEGSPLGVVTVSVGVATTLPRAGKDDGAALIAAADQHLYTAKREGRNRISPGLLEAVKGRADNTLPSRQPAAEPV